MKYSSAIAILTLAFFSSCSLSTNKDKNMLPENPKDNQTYTDCNGNSWVYNAMLMRWMMSSGGSTYYYYPSHGYYTNSSGIRVTPPKKVSSGITPSKSSYSKSMFGTRSTSRGAVFGSIGRSHSISA